MDSTPLWPVLGQMEPHPAGNVPDGEPFMKFDTGKVDGLARVKDTSVDFLAIHAACPGNGHFSWLLASLKNAYRTIRVFAVVNSRFGEYLRRNGFVSELDLMGFSVESVLVWRQPFPPSCTPPSPSPIPPKSCS